MMQSLVIRLRRSTLLGAIAYNILAFTGCGTAQQGTADDDWMSGPPVSMTARLEYRVDSLTNENRRLSQQLEAVQAENKNLNMRLTEAQSKPAEPAITKPVSPAPAGTMTKKSSMPAAYETALGKFRGRDYQGAIEEFNELLNGGVSNDLVDNCHFWIGESYFAMKKYDEAIASFQKATGIADSEKGDDAQLMIGNAYLAQGNKAQAKKAFQKLISLYPTSPLTKRAQVRMKSL